MMAGGGILLRYLLLLAAASSAGGRVAGWNGSGAAFTRLGCLRGGAALEDPADIFYAGSTSPQASEQGWVEAHDPLPNPVEGVVGEGNSSKPEAVQCSEWEGLQMAWSRLSEDILSGRTTEAEAAEIETSLQARATQLWQGIACGTQKKSGKSAIATKRQQKRCSNPDGCEKQPAYGKRGSAAIGATYCVVHRPSGFVNVKNRKCLGAWGIGCPKQPTFGAKEDSVPLYCSQHKREGDLDLRHKKCQADGCTRQPSFGNATSGEGAVRCKEHKVDGDEDIKHRNRLKTSQSRFAKAKSRHIGEGEDVGNIFVSTRIRRAKSLKGDVQACGVASGRGMEEHDGREMAMEQLEPTAGGRDLEKRYCCRCGSERVTSGMPGESMSGLWLRFYCLRCFKKRQSGGIREMSRERDVSPKFRLLAEGGGAAEEGRVIAAKIMSLTKRCFRCFHRASYAASDGASPSHCSKHRPLGYRDVANTKKECVIAGCRTHTKYPRKDGTRPMYCLRHRSLLQHTELDYKIPDVPVSRNSTRPMGLRFPSQVCQYAEGCSKQPSFGDPRGPMMWCSNHKAEVHVNLRRSDSPVGMPSWG